MTLCSSLLPISLGLSIVSPFCARATGLQLIVLCFFLLHYYNGMWFCFPFFPLSHLCGTHLSKAVYEMFSNNLKARHCLYNVGKEMLSISFLHLVTLKRNLLKIFYSFYSKIFTRTSYVVLMKAVDSIKVTKS